MERDRPTILIVSRGHRLSAFFGEIARELSSKAKVIVTLGVIHSPLSAENPKDWENIPGSVLIDLPNEAEKNYLTRKSQPQTLPNYIREIENDLELPLYKAASNYLIYRKFAKEYYHYWDGYCDTEEQMNEEFVGSYDVFKKIFDSYQPDLVFLETPDLISHRVVFALARKRGIFAVWNSFIPPMGKGQAALVSGTNRRNVLLEHYLRRPDLILEESRTKAEIILAQFQEGEVPDAAHIKNYRMKSQTTIFLQPSFSRRKLRDWLSVSNVKKAIARYTNLNWLEANLKKELPQAPYILFPLHHQPEAATSLVAPRWGDQDRVIELLSIHAPAGWKIVVKENPKTYGYRGKNFFGNLAALPNVHLLNPSVSNGLAMQNATAILAIAGTSGVEGILMGKPVGVLSDCYYTVYPNAWKLTAPEEIFERLRTQGIKKTGDTEERIKFTSALVQSCLYLGDGFKGSPWPEPRKGAPRYATALLNFLKVVKEAKLSPADFDLAT